MYLAPDTLLQGGKYRIVRYIAHGGFGCTYEAVNTSWNNRRVAIKELFVGDFCNRNSRTHSVEVVTQSKQPLFDKLRRKFLSEASKLDMLIHPGIVRVTDAFEENNTAYYVMDYIEGRSLRDIVASRGALREMQALRFIRQVADALNCVHSRKLLHLDIKPANIMIDRNSNAILIDFGISKQYDEEMGENNSTLLGYTVGYAPAEQMCGSVRSFTPATDIYSLGATLYFLLSGVVPPPAGELATGGGLPPLPEGISAATRKAVEAAMTVNISRRPQSIPDFLAILDGETLRTGENKTVITTADIEKKTQIITTHGSETDERKEIEIQFVESDPENLPPVESGHAWIWRLLAMVVLAIAIASGIHSCRTHLANVAAEKLRNDSIAREQFVADSIAEIEREAYRRLFPLTFVEGGTFKMGATSRNEGYVSNDEFPVHAVTLDDFYMSTTLVTQAQWIAVMGTNPSYRKGDNLPVEQVSYNDAVDFCNTLSALTDRVYRLPTEAEWEYAARGGKKSKGYKYSGSDNIEQVAWYINNSDQKTHPVAQKAPNELGLYDMSGNLWEWCSDWYDANYYQVSPQNNPEGPDSGTMRVLRGGGCYYSESTHIISERGADDDDDRSPTVGFRIVCQLTEN